MQQLSGGRRRFLRRTAMVVGAFLVGIGRTNTAFATTPACYRCNGDCSAEQVNEDCDHALCWVHRNDSSVMCCECYRNAADVQKAREEARARRLSDACFYCENVVCGYTTKDGHPMFVCNPGYGEYG